MDNGMMTETRAAIVVEGVVANIILVDPSSDWAPDEGELIRDIPDTANIGDSFSDGSFTPPPPPAPSVPTSISQAQGMIILFNRGLLSTVRTMVKNHPYEPIRLWFDYAGVWERANPYLNALALELGLTEDQIDDLFIAAAKL